MIFFLKGILVTKTPTFIEVDKNGVGFGLFIPISTFDVLPEIGFEVSVFTHLYVREDLLSLYGFSTKNEKEMFITLIKVSGIGPKVAIAMLSTLTDSQIQNAVITEDVKLISSVPGIGKKTAERLIVELKDKISKKTKIHTKDDLKNKNLDSKVSDFEDALSALQTLGYSLKDATKAINHILGDKQNYSLEVLIKNALKVLIKK